jgi:MFS family permease
MGLEKPLGLKWRSSTSFILGTVAMSLFTDLFLYGLVVPLLPFILEERVQIPNSRIQSYTSGLLAAYAAASVAFSLPAGYLADHISTRRMPFLIGLTALMAATLLFATGNSVVVLTVARVLQGISAAVVWTVGLALVYDTVGSAHLGKTIGSVRRKSSIILRALLTGEIDIWDYLHWRTCFTCLRRSSL